LQPTRSDGQNVRDPAGRVVERVGMGRVIVSTNASDYEAPQPQAELLDDAAPLRVLVVDDDPSIVELLTTFLEQDGCEVTSETDGEAALQAVAAAPPEVLVLDIMMPGLDGLDVCGRVRALGAEGRQMAIILITALDSRAYRALAESHDADDYVAKPFDIPELLKKVRAWGRFARSHT
jgi:DNA-binding response OmpR family regulator